jgi:hypothetical protein
MSLGMKLKMHWAWLRGATVLVSGGDSYLAFKRVHGPGGTEWLDDLRAKGWSDWKPGWVR